MKITKAIATAYMKISRWTFVHEDLPEKVVIIGAPHTSYYDAVLMIMAAWKVERNFRFLVKDSAAEAPVLGWILRKVGGISTHRSNPAGLVDKLIAEAEASPTFTLVITPKGTRAQRQYWKSGFYRIARAVDIPIQLGFIDRSTMTYGWGPSLRLSGDVSADMDQIRAFYAGKTGIRPALTSVPRLRAEDSSTTA